MPTDAQGRIISDDGHYWWDGTAWQLIQRPAGKSFLDTVADSVEGAVKKVEGSPAASGPIVQVGPSAPAGSQPAAQAPPAAAAPPAGAPAFAAPPAATPAPAAAAPPAVTATAAAPAAAAPAAAAPVPPAIPAADLHAYIGALKSVGVVTEAEFADISQRIRARG